MKTLPRSAFSLLCGLISAGWFWSMGTPWEPGEKLGLAYGMTALITVLGFIFAPVKGADV